MTTLKMYLDCLQTHSGVLLYIKNISTTIPGFTEAVCIGIDLNLDTNELDYKLFLIHPKPLVSVFILSNEIKTYMASSSYLWAEITCIDKYIMDIAVSDALISYVDKNRVEWWGKKQTSAYEKLLNESTGESIVVTDINSAYE
jgi:hypothetical protein